MTAQPLELEPTVLPGVRRLKGLSGYEVVWNAMREWTERREPDTPDEIWLVEHHPVYTLGVAGKPEHVLNTRGIALVRSDRGGQVTYHGPGQVVAYVLADLRRLGITVRDLVNRLEQAVIDTMQSQGLTQARRLAGAPGIFWPMDNGELAKVGALGLKVRKGCTYHGVSLNVDMDLSPFDNINPCGYAGLQTVNMVDLGADVTCDEVAVSLAGHIQKLCVLQVE